MKGRNPNNDISGMEKNPNALAVRTYKYYREAGIDPHNLSEFASNIICLSDMELLGERLRHAKIVADAAAAATVSNVGRIQ